MKELRSVIKKIVYFFLKNFIIKNNKKKQKQGSMAEWQCKGLQIL